MFFAPVLRTRTYSPRAFDRSFERFVQDAFDGRRTAANVTQDDTTWTITLDMPGVTKDQLEIGIEGAVVRISTKAEAARKYSVAYELPQDVDTSVSKAQLENGVLTLTLGKKVPVSNVTQLAVQ